MVWGLLILIFAAQECFSLRNWHTAEAQGPVLMALYKKDCWKTKPVSPSLAQIPGAGITDITPFVTVEKDGYSPVDCTKDYMYYHGDKYGDNKFDYKLGEVSNVSIAHYTVSVPSEDRQPMTHNVCFEFCRTVPDMGFFGITNGRDCYCTPYYKAQESDSSMCDAPCDGDKTKMCGGKKKSTVFEMHMCASTSADVTAAVNDGVEVAGETQGLVSTAKELSGTMQTAAAALQSIFGEAGDPDAANLMQLAKQWAGELLHEAERAEKVEDKLRGYQTTATGLGSMDDPAEVTKAERIMEQTEVSLNNAKHLNTQLGKSINATSPAVSSDNTSKQYYPMMYFVDKEYQDVPATCTGGNVGKPIVAEESSSCAASCDADVHDCVGFFYVGAPHNLCFLLSSFKRAMYFTDCTAAPFKATCMAKVSKFAGTTLKPDGSGKCKQCLKDATKADRCY